MDDLERLRNMQKLFTVGAVLESKAPAKPKKFWMSEKPTTCQLCHKPLRDVFVDGGTIMGPWAIMCRKCHIMYGRGTGCGCGQLYNLETLEKIEG